VSEPFKFQFCEALDGLLSERTRLTAITALTNLGPVNWLQHFLVNRALKKNLRLIQNHECGLCEMTLRNPQHSSLEPVSRLMEAELTTLRFKVERSLKHELNEGLLD
jgi:hypothetical protein